MINRQQHVTTSFVSSPLTWRSRGTFQGLCSNHNQRNMAFLVPQRRTITCSAAQELQKRMSSVQTAEKLVSALRLVAAARIRAASNEALRARPFADEIQRMVAALVKLIHQRQIPVQKIAYDAAGLTYSPDSMPNQEAYSALLDRVYLALLSQSPHLTDPTSSIIVITVITSDRGFCGSYNKDVLRKSVARIRELRQHGCEVELVLVGRIAQNFFKAHYPNLIVRSQVLLGRVYEAKDTAMALSDSLLKEFVGGGVGRMEIIYTRFVSLIASTPSARTILPLTPNGIESVGDELFEMRLTTHNGRLTAKREQSKRSSGSGEDLGYEISDEEAILLLNTMLPMYVTSQLIRIISEAIAAEQGTRLTAMSAAADNAKNLGQNLKSQYNKKRQEKITSEIIEVLANVHT